MKKSTFKPLLTVGLFAGLCLFAAAVSVSAQVNLQELDSPLTIVSPAAWSTLRSDSVTVAAQVDAAKLPRGTVSFRVLRTSGRSMTTLFTRVVNAEDFAGEVFLGRVRAADIPIGGNDFISIEWTVPGSDYKGSVGPVGIVRIDGEMTDDKWTPALPPVAAVRIADGASHNDIETALAAAEGFAVGGAASAMGWNSDGLFIRLLPAGAMTRIEFAFDLRAAKAAFLGRADRFITYDPEDGSLNRAHYGSNRNADFGGITREEGSWGADDAVRLIRPDGDSDAADGARIIMIRWSELGALPFEGRNIGFSAFATGRGLRQPVFPAASRRELPGTWGNVRLEP